MATGPALRKLASHRAIHNGTYGEAKELLDMIVELYEEDRQDDCKKVSEAMIHYIEERLIAHADAEEEGLYLDIKRENPELEKDIHMLTRDHDLERIIFTKIKELFSETEQVSKELINHFHALLIINDIHNRTEEELLPEH